MQSQSPQRAMPSPRHQFLCVSVCMTMCARVSLQACVFRAGWRSEPRSSRGSSSDARPPLPRGMEPAAAPPRWRAEPGGARPGARGAPAGADLRHFTKLIAEAGRSSQWERASRLVVGLLEGGARPDVV